MLCYAMLCLPLTRADSSLVLARLLVCCRLTAAAGPGAKAADGALIAYTPGQGPAAAAAAEAAPGGVAAPQQQKAIMAVINDKGKGSAAVSRRLASKWPKPVWHPPWKCYRVISGHLG
jgi:pleiotropic regulator 1